MTKLEAWKAWCATAGTEQLANPFTLENSSHGKAFSYAWVAAHEACAKVCLDMQNGWASDDHLRCAAAIQEEGKK